MGVIMYFPSLSPFRLLSNAWEFATRSSESQEDQTSEITPLPKEFPKDIIQHIVLNYLPKCSERKDILNYSLVSKKWRALTLDDRFFRGFPLEVLFKGRAIFYGKADWEEHFKVEAFGLDLEEEGRPCVNRAQCEELMDLLAKKKVKLTIYLRPGKLSFNRLRQFAENRDLIKQGRSTPFGDIWSKYEAKFGDAADEKACTMAITEEIVPGSNLLTREEKKEQVKACGLKVVDVMTAIVIRHNASEEGPPMKLYKDYWTYCADEVDDHFAALVHFAPAGPRVISSSFDIDDIGGGGLRKFSKVIGT